ncbi:urea ABC transporter permease subunit UrtC [Termitidicoccus mucosus]|uniref:urea ABC transporter permease subunit UrtC n=1 Tax=Termitidicoccus mucosus TaxID=1184151 RepID=UPI000A02A574
MSSITTDARHKIELAVIAACAVFLIVVFPLLNAAGVVSNFTLNVWGKYLCYAMLAISVDLLWGHTGLLSLGQALFFSLGGYMMGMHLMRMIGALGQYQQPIPDFLVFLGWTDLPWFWKPFSSFPFALSMVFLVPGLLALVFGYLAFRSRIKGVYFSILTQALTYGAALMFFRNDMLLGGNNGFTDFKFILGADIRSAATQRGLYIATAVALLLVFIGCRALGRTKFGLIQRAIRDGENRVLFSGYSAASYKLFVFVLSACIAAVAGALYVPQVGIINPSEMTPDKSLEAVVWVAVGGRATLAGPIIGAVGINALKSWATRAIPDLWLLLLGGLFVLVVLFLPGGIVSLPARLKTFAASPAFAALRRRFSLETPPPGGGAPGKAASVSPPEKPPVIATKTNHAGGTKS